ncbi:MAG: peptide deformylase [Candidatus Cloacimonadota bacterium]|nr:peptide deformylase [Candidatus Cloacimonadota bacterium]
MLEKIRLYGDESLRKIAKPIPMHRDDEIKNLSKNLIESLERFDGIGLAAPQIGRSVRMFAVYPLWIEDEKKRKTMIFINPTLLELEGIQNEEEGCLSIPEIFEKVKRAKTVSFKAQNLFGKWKQYIATDLFARVVQHEYDHLDGILFVDKISLIKRRLLQGKLKKIAATTKRGINIASLH